MSTLFVMVVMGLVLTVNFSDVIPTVICWYFPLLSVIFTGLLYVSLPFIADCHDGTEKLLWEGKRNRLNASKSCRNWLYFLNRVDNNETTSAYRSKVLLAMKPVSIKCGDFYVVKGDKKSTYFNGIIERTFDLILLTQKFKINITK